MPLPQTSVRSPRLPFALPFALLFALCLLCQFTAARWISPNSDTVQNYNELLAVRSSNVLLHGWVLARTTYYFSDLPVFVLASVIFGATPRLVYIAPAIIFAGFLAACCLLTSRMSATTVQRRFALLATLYLLGLPFAPQLSTLLVAAVHGAALTLSLFAILLAEPALSGRRFNRWRLLGFGVLVFAAAASDPFCLSYLFGPLLLLVVLRLWLRPAFRLDEWLLCATTLIAGALAAGFPPLVAATGGFTIAPSPPLDLVSGMSEAWINVRAVLSALQQLFTARAKVLPHLFLMGWVARSREIAAVIVAALCARIAWRLPQVRTGDGLAQLFVVGAACLAALDVIAAQFSIARSYGIGFPYAAIRYVMPVYVLSALAAVIEAQRLIEDVWARWPRLLCGVTAGLVALFALGAVEAARKQAAAPAGIDRAAQATLSRWLLARGFRHGVGDYWTAGMVSTLSRGLVHDTPVRDVGNGRLAPFDWASDMSGLAQRPPEFAAFPADDVFGLSVPSATATYGPARAVRQVKGYTVVEFDR